MGWPEIDDDELFGLIDREVERQNTTIQLIASENFTSPAVLRATGSVLTNKYSEGYPGKRYYGGNEVIDEVEALAIERAKSLFGADHANVQPHAGANANMGVYLALLEPGDTVLGLRLDQGGHLTHGSPVNASGKLYDFVSYGVTASDERIDFDQVRDVRARAPAQDHRRRRHRLPPHHRPAAVPRHRRRGRRATSCSTPPTSPASSPAAPTPRRCRSPTSSPSPPTRRCAARAAAASCAPRSWPPTIDKAMFPGLQGGPLDHVIAAKAVAFAEAATATSRDYAAQIVRNAEALAEGLAGRGLRLVSGGTDNHLLLVDLRSYDEELSGKKARLALDRAGISLNENTVPDDPRPPVHHLRPAHRHAGGDHPGHGRGRDGDDRRPHRAHPRRAARTRPSSPPSATRSATLCGKFEPYPV